MKRLIIVRHVETRGNVEGRFNGISESPYTPRGLRMKALLEDTLCAMAAKTPIDRVLVSPIERARKIGEAVAERLGIPCEVTDALKEYNFGIFDGLTPEEAREKAPEIWDAWMADYDHFVLPGSEPAIDYHNRLRAFARELTTSPGDETLLLVGHGGSMRGLIMGFLALPYETMWHVHTALGSMAVVCVHEGFGTLEMLTTPDYDVLN